MRVAAIVQARMRSTRMPGKVLREISGRAVLGHVIDRLWKCPSVTDVAVVTSTEAEDDAIAEFCAREGVPVFRGEEEDVLGRYILAVEALDPALLLRVTGDCPVLSEALIESFIAQLVRQGADFLVAEKNIPCIQEGVDVISRVAFDLLVEVARQDPYAREHVTSYLKLHPELARIGTLVIPQEFRLGGVRISVDTPADLRFLQTLEDRLGPLGRIALEDVVALLRREPWLMTINAHIHQKGAGDVNGTVLIRADGGGSLGFGHLMRCLSLAHELRETQGLGVVFLTGLHPMGDAAAAKAAISRDDFPVLEPADLDQGGAGEAQLVAVALARTRAAHLICDIRTGLTRAELEELKLKGLSVTVIDDASPRRLAGDLSVYPLVPAVDELGWAGFGGRVLVGGDWTLLSARVSRAAQTNKTRPKDPAPHILVTLGGSDPMNWTLPVVEACAERAWPLGTVLDVIVGPGVQDRDALVGALSRIGGARAHVDPDNLEDLMAGADLAVAAFGVSAYELAALGVPSIYLFLTEDHRRSASALIGAGAGFAGSGAGALAAARVAKAASLLVRDVEAREAMAGAGRRTIDGQAAARLAAEIKLLVKDRQSVPEQSRLPPEMRLASPQAPAAG